MVPSLALISGTLEDIKLTSEMRVDVHRSSLTACDGMWRKANSRSTEP